MLKRLRTKLKGFFDSSSHEPVKESVTEFPKFNEKNHLLENEPVFRKILDHIDKSAEKLWEMGKVDGQLFNSNANEVASVAHHEARSTITFILRSLIGERERLNQDKIVLENKIKHEEDIQNHQRSYQLLSINNFNYSTNSYSIILMLLYLACGTILLLSDFVLASQLIRDGFHELDTGNFAELLPYDSSKFHKNWQVLLVSLGITTITVYIKIFYDEHVGNLDGFGQIRISNIFKKRDSPTPYQRWVNQFLLLSEVLSKFVIKLVILGAVLWLLIQLAEFRFNTWTITSLNRVLDFTEADLTKRVLDNQPLARRVFWGMTLIFPIVAGVCFSLAFKIFGNVQRLASSKGLSVWSWVTSLFNNGQYLSKTQTAVNQLHEKLGKIDYSIKYWESLLNSSEFSTYLQSCYNIGFSRSYTHYRPDLTGETSQLIDRIRRYRDFRIEKQQIINFKNQ